jgi:putative peptidoglycan lipid II flippase
MRESSPRLKRGSALLVGFLTFCSRVSGMVRDGALAMLLGASLANDLFQLCFELPNLVRRIIGDSALAPLVLPLRRQVFRDRGRVGVESLATRATPLFLGAGALLAAGAALAAPVIVRLFLPAWSELAQTDEGREILARAETLVRISSLYLGAPLAASFLAALLQGEGDFLIPSLGGLPLNFLLIALAFGGLAAWGPRGAETAPTFLADPVAWRLTLILAWGVVAGGFLRLLLMLGGAARLGMRPRWEPLPREALAGRWRRLGPLLLVMATPQLYVSVHLALLSFWPPDAGVVGAAGALSALRYAHRVMEFPLALVAGALATVSLPAMLEGEGSARASKSAGRELALSLERFFWLGIPAAVGLAMLARPSVAFLFQRGAWDAADSAECARYLSAWALALPALGAGLATTPAGLAFAGVRPMLRDGLAALALGTAASAALYGATGDPAWLPLGAVPAEAWRAARAARRVREALGEESGQGLSGKTLLWAAALPALASGAMAAVLFFSVPWLLPADVIEQAGFARLGPRLAMASALGAGVYFAAWGGLKFARQVFRPDAGRD